MDKPKVTVTLPVGGLCNDGKLCIFARFTRKWNAYNCALHHQILKGGQNPAKCQKCLAHCAAQERVTH